MKKIISTILLIALLSSCSLIKKEIEVESTSSWETVIVDEQTITSSWETVIVDESWNTDLFNLENNNIEINTESDESLEKDIENIIDTNNWTSKEDVTEEEILNDIDSLINDIIKSAENG